MHTLEAFVINIVDECSLFVHNCVGKLLKFWLGSGEIAGEFETHARSN